MCFLLGDRRGSCHPLSGSVLLWLLLTQHHAFKFVPLPVRGVWDRTAPRPCMLILNVPILGAQRTPGRNSGTHVHERNLEVIGIFLGGRICRHVQPTDTLWPQGQRMGSVVSKYPPISGQGELEDGAVTRQQGVPPPLGSSRPRGVSGGWRAPPVAMWLLRLSLCLPSDSRPGLGLA